MALRIVCICGYVIQGEDDDELWRKVQGHRASCTPMRPVACWFVWGDCSVG